MWLQAEHERKRILQRLKEAREARTKPHQARWFEVHPQVLHKNDCPVIAIENST